MNKYILTFFLIFFSFQVCGEAITEIWNKYKSEYVLGVSSSNYNQALKAALELNKIEPSNTEAMYGIVLSSVKLGVAIPEWLFEQPWPNATSEDREFYKKALVLKNGT